jgi:hypothetical protein
MVSINVNKGFSHNGAPAGSSEAENVCILYISLDMINLSHKGNAKVSVKIKCLEMLKLYGIKPIMLIVMVTMKMVDNMWDIPFSDVVWVRVD